MQETTLALKAAVAHLSYLLYSLIQRIRRDFREGADWIAALTATISGHKCGSFLPLVLKIRSKRVDDTDICC